ncbi:MAG: hypothetical protein Q9M32_07155 [Sulfurimonas sp.]|nr:hypothetical protein [Sulfurimonas sp.]MDQ7061392.1 hypothetical protein [Sulfurimonas sp.]
MKKLLLVSLLSLSFVLFTACSSKRVFEPEDVKDDWEKYGSIEETIVDVTSDVAMLENRKVISKDSDIDVLIDEDYRLIASSDGWIISSTIDGKLRLKQIDATDIVEEFELKKTVASASVDDDTLAVLFADNEMALYSITTKELLLKEQGGNTLAVDSRIVAPYFLDAVVVFPTLDGKVVIISRSKNKKLRASIVSSEDNFNNIIYFDIIDRKIVAATANQILSMSKKEVREKYEIRNVTYNGLSIFLTTKQGEIVSLTPELQLNAKLKFPFAHFLGLIARNDKVYALEKEGYLIVAPSDLSSYEIYEVDVDEGFVFVGKDKFYINDEFISVE